MSAEYGLRHVTRLLGKALVVSVSDATVKASQTLRLKKSAEPKCINEGIGFILRMLGHLLSVIPLTPVHPGRIVSPESVCAKQT
jgi:hypothetical protein